MKRVLIKSISVIFALVFFVFGFSFSFKSNAVWIDYTQPIFQKTEFLLLDHSYYVKGWNALIGGIHSPDSIDAIQFDEYVFSTSYPTISYIEIDKDWFEEEYLMPSFTSTIQTYFPYVNMIAKPTYEYNCHSYAWYSQDCSSNIFWVEEPIYQYVDNDESYEQTTNPVIGDIICYMDDNGTPNNYSDDSILHSGIISSLLSGTSNGLCGNSDMFIVQSKWGWGGLCKHNGYECPYTSYYNSDSADYVIFFHRQNHTHSFTSYSQSTGYDDMAYHRKSCSTCGEIIYESHSWVEYMVGGNESVAEPNYTPVYYCSKCGAMSLHSLS